MRRWDPLNDRQLQLLRLVAAGDDISKPEHLGLRRSASAVRDRGLITITGRGVAWRAELTDDGRFYLDHGHHPDDPRHPDVPSTSVHDAGRAASRRPSRPQPGERQVPIARSRSIDAARLMKEVWGAGGTLRIEAPEDAVRAAYRRAIHAAKQHNHVPVGYHLLHTGRNGGDLIIRLSDDGNPDETDWNRIRLGIRDCVSSGPALSALIRDNPETLEVSDSARPRALALVEALAAKAARYGFKLTMSKRGKPRGLHIQAGKRKYRLTIKEGSHQVERQKYPGVGTGRVYSWQRVKTQYETVPSGRLTLTLSEQYQENGSEWTDSDRSPLESRLNGVLKEVDRRVRAAEEALKQWAREEDTRRLEREEAERRKRDEWNSAIESARSQAQDAYRIKSFKAAMRSWQSAVEIRTFCDALERSAGDISEDLRSWIAWGRATAASIDPTGDLASLAEVPFKHDPSPDELRPYLDDWSPHRPEKEWHTPRVETNAPATSEDYRPWHPGLRGRAQWWRR